MIRDDGLTASECNTAYDEPEFAHEKPEPEEKQPHELDSPKHIKLLHRLQEWYEQEWQRQAFNRYQMAMDEDYYDSLQYSEEDAQVLMDRGQAPIVYNEIKSTIDWMIGTERRTRIDYKVLPRKKEGLQDAEVKTKLLKYLSDVNKEVYARSAAFGKCVKGGMGWIEIGIRGDSTDEPIFYRSQDWRYMLYDSNGIERDLSDSRYLFRWKYIDTDISEAIFPDRKDIIKQSTVDGNKLAVGEEEDELWYMGARVTEPGADFSASTSGKYRPYDGSAFAFSRRCRVKMIECWYRDPVRKKRMSGGDFDGDEYDAGKPEHLEAMKDDAVSIYDRVEMEIRCAIFTDAGLLFDGPSPYNHGRFPFVPVWAYRRSRDNAPYSPIRSMRDPQDSLNKRGSKALWILSTNRIIMDESAVSDIDELREEAARPDSIIVKKKGYQLEMERDVSLADEHLKLMDRDQRYILNVGGVTGENLGRETNADSGKAIVARQEQGSVVTTELYDNHRYAAQLAGEIELSLAEQFITDEKIVRVTGERGTSTHVEINKYDEETGETLNDITQTQADFVISEQDYRSSVRIAMFESLFDIVGRLAQMNPEAALNLLDLVVDMADIPNRDELVARIRQLNGQRDPESEPTPEEIQAAKEQQAFQQEKQDVAMETARAELDKLIAERGKLDADAVDKRLNAIYSSLQASQIVAQAPGTAAVADSIMEGAGHQDLAPDIDAEIVNQAGDEMQPPNTPLLPAPQSPSVGQTQGIETPEADGMRGNI